MTYIEVSFLLFLLVSIAVFYLFPVKHRWIALLIESIVFYAFSGPAGYLWIFLTSMSVWLGARRMGRYYEEAALRQENVETRKEKKAVKDAARRKCKRVLVILIVLNIGILACFKGFHYMAAMANYLPGGLYFDGKGASAFFLLLPLGISYYTFSAVGYLLDVYWQRIKYEKNYARFLLFEIYFLHILQGPIERYGRLGERLKGTFRFDYERACQGMQLMIWGFFKKLVIADRLNMFITQAYRKSVDASGAVYLAAVLFDVVFIYADFSGCMDIARGASQIFGIEMDLNFDHPFSSRSITEFWRRWHMSLGGWFRDYVYFPLSTSRTVKNISRYCSRKQLPAAVSRGLVTIIPVSVTWVLTGLWHGTGRAYIAWGIYYAGWIFISVVFGEPLHNLAVRLGIRTEAWSWKLLQTVRTTLIFAGGRLLTRPNSLRYSWNYFKTIFTDFQPWTIFDGTMLNYGLTGVNFWIALAGIAVFGVVSSLQMRMQIRKTLAQQNIVFRWGLCLLAVFVILIFGIYGPGYAASSFVYMEY